MNDDEVVCTHCGCEDWIELTLHEQAEYGADYECECCGRLFDAAPTAAESEPPP